ncbi:MAG TPA: hypothetical protein VNO30_30985 [Kofleriaceae bacterium]|nr:hypothetical protein [Kofleriaceae bacterium]
MTTELDAEELDVDDLEEIPQVAASEHDLIMMARTLVMGPAAQDDIWTLLCAARPCAPQIGPTCAALLEDTLRHAWRALWMRGGARPAASISISAAAPPAPPAAPGAPAWASASSRTVTITRGRLWERHAPAPLPFTSASLVFLRWLVATPFAAPASTLTQLAAMPLSIGDQLLVYLALDAARTTPAVRVLAAQPFVRAAPLAWLGHAHALARRGAAPPSFGPLTEGVGAIVVEALAGELARRWYAVELGKRAMFEPEPLLDLGAAQDQTLTGFMTACEAAARRDLAAFVLDAAAPLLLRNVMPAPLQLDPNTTLAVRAQARLAAGSLVRAVVRWGEWDGLHRGVRYFDDDYPAAQLLLERFETIGPTGLGRARHWLTELASLVPSPTASDTVTAP